MESSSFTKDLSHCLDELWLCENREKDIKNTPSYVCFQTQESGSPFRKRIWPRASHNQGHRLGNEGQEHPEGLEDSFPSTLRDSS